MREPEPPAPRRLRSNVRAILAGNVAYAAGLWLQLALFARYGGAAAVGTYAFALALVQPAMVLSQLQLRILLVSDAHHAYSFREYRALRLATTALAVLAMVPVSWISGQARTVWPILGPVCLQAAADSVTDVYSGLWQRDERMATGAWALAINAGSSVALMAAAALAGLGPPGMATGSALGSCLALLYVRLRTGADARLRPHLTHGAPPGGRRLLRLAREAAPLGVIVLLGSLQTNLPRYAIQRFTGVAALGLFAAAYQLTSAGTLVVQALGGAAAPRLARAWAGADRSGFARLTRWLALAGAALAVAGIAASALVGGPVLALLFRPEFRAAAGVLLVLSAAAGLGFVATLLGIALTAARVLVSQAAALSTTVAVTFVTCLLLVPRLGAAGAAWALVAAAAVQVAWSAALIRRLRAPRTDREPEPAPVPLPRVP